MLVNEMPFEAWSDSKYLVFPKKILEDDWVLYHGTSKPFEESIEKNGLNASLPNPITKEVIQRLAGCFEWLNWAGNNAGGYAVLSSFTRHDYSFDNKPIYLGESFRRSLTFASEDFAGGEGCRAIRKGIKDLHDFLKDPEIRLGAQNQQIRVTVNERGEVIPEDLKLIEDLDWLRNELSDLTPIEGYVKNIANQHQYGIVYAIRFDEADLPKMKHNSCMGIMHFGTIHPSKIIAKLIVQSEQQGLIFDSQRLTNTLIWKSRLAK
jgi:hypothetical protein